jgi:glucokinase
MGRTVGVSILDRLAAGTVQDNRLASDILRFPESDDPYDSFQVMPADEIAAHIAAQIELAAGGEPVAAAGVGLPGIVRNGVVEESPNLVQMKGYAIHNALLSALGKRNPGIRVAVANNADAMAAGIAATRGQLDRLVRVWALGHGIGFGHYPAGEAVWEGGHQVVTLDPKETYCGCGGVGHLEGIMGYRAMRLRFLDMEPEEIFASASAGDTRCADFVRLWHRALAAGTASSIHMDGAGRFFITGPSAVFVDTTLLRVYMQDMVKMSSLQSYSFEVVPGGDDVAIIGAAVHAERADAATGHLGVLGLSRGDSTVSDVNWPLHQAGPCG